MKKEKPIPWEDVQKICKCGEYYTLINKFMDVRIICFVNTDGIDKQKGICRLKYSELLTIDKLTGNTRYYEEDGIFAAVVRSYKLYHATKNEIEQLKNKK